MATVAAGGASGNFKGFDEKDKELDEGRYQRRARLSESVLNELVVKLGQLEKKNQ